MTDQKGVQACFGYFKSGFEANLSDSHGYLRNPLTLDREILYAQFTILMEDFYGKKFRKIEKIF